VEATMTVATTEVTTTEVVEDMEVREEVMEEASELVEMAWEEDTVEDTLQLSEAEALAKAGDRNL